MRASPGRRFEHGPGAGAIFDMVRDVNAAADRGEVKQGDIALLLEAMREV